MKEFANPAARLLLACHRGDADEARAIFRDTPGLMERLEPAERRALTDEAWAANAPAVELLLEFHRTRDEALHLFALRVP